MERLCVYLIYDKENIIDRYIGYILKELKKCVSYLCVVFNGSEINQGKEYLQDADEIFFRENKGFDAGGFKDVLCNLFGWDRALEYDELILVNDSFFGPFISFEEIFAEMEQLDVDFWGLLSHAEAINEGFGYIPEHIQSFFIDVKYHMFHSTYFKEYWSNMPYYETFIDVVKYHEIRFTDYFFKKGFKYAVYANTELNNSQNLKNNYIQYMNLSYELIQKRKFPFLKRQQLAYNTLNQQTQENLRQSIQYIDLYTDYDVNMIWENIIRTMDLSDLQRSLCLQYVLTKENTNREILEEDILIIVNACYESAYENVIDYLNQIKNISRIKIYVTNEKLYNFYTSYGFVCINKELNIEELGKYVNNKYVCILYDEDLSSDYLSSYIGKSHFYGIWENLVGSVNYIKNVINILEKEQKLGFLTHPSSNFGIYFKEFGEGWMGCYDRIHKILIDSEINCKCSEDKHPFAKNNCFWIRGQIFKSLQKLKNIVLEDLRYIWIYLCQHEGFYAGIVETTEYASMNEINQKYYLDILVEQIKNQYGEFHSFLECKQKIFQGALYKFCSQYKKIYIYGTGYMAGKYSALISNIEGYIVSDGQQKQEYIDNKKVYFLSEIDIKNEIGIIICLDKKYQVQVLPLLRERGFTNYLCI
mgnify:CR=1 FL=1